MLYMFQAVPPPIIRSSKLYTQHRVFVEIFSASYRYREWVGTAVQLQPTHDSGKKQKKARQIPDAVYTVLRS